MVWPVHAGGTGNEFGQGITSLEDGSSLVTGSFTGTARFGKTTLQSAGQGRGTSLLPSLILMEIFSGSQGQEATKGIRAIASPP